MFTQILLALSLGSFFGFVWRSFLKMLKNKKISIRARMNIGKQDKLIRWVIGFVLFYLGFKSGSFWFVFFAGFAFFEAIFSWCGFYALLGRNTCEI